MPSNATLFHQVRRLFYAVRHDEERYAEPGDVPNYIQEATPLFLTALAIEFVIASWHGIDILRVNDAITSLSCGALRVAMKMLLGSAQITAFVYVHNNFKLVDLPWDSGITWWIALIGIDFLFYWFHRAAHGDLVKEEFVGQPQASQVRVFSPRRTLESAS